MNSEEEIIKERKERLRADLETDLQRHWNLARWDHRLSLILVNLGLAASALAGIGGLLKASFLGEVTQPIIGGLALVPAGVAVVETTLKLTQKASWRYRRRDALRGLLRRLEYPAGAGLSLAEISSVAQAYTQLDEAMTEAWINTVVGAAGKTSASAT
jgi:hypothetical protein